MKQLANEAYQVGKDNLIYDAYRPIDVQNVEVAVPEGEGVLKRGQIIDFDGGTYCPHAQNGTANSIVAEDTPYGADETKVVVPAYISGNFRQSVCIPAAELTVTDKENLRGSGIILK